MAKGARASTKKANNVKLKSKVFGPVETDRTARLSAKLLALAAQPKPKPAEKDVEMEAEDGRISSEEIVVLRLTYLSCDGRDSGSSCRAQGVRRYASLQYSSWSLLQI